MRNNRNNNSLAGCRLLKLPGLAIFLGPKLLPSLTPLHEDGGAPDECGNQTAQIHLGEEIVAYQRAISSIWGQTASEMASGNGITVSKRNIAICASPYVRLYLSGSMLCPAPAARIVELDFFLKILLYTKNIRSRSPFSARAGTTIFNTASSNIRRL